MYTYCVFFIGSLLMPTCKTEFNGLETTSYLFPKDETSSMVCTHTHTYIRMESNTFFIMSFYIYVEYMFYYIFVP